MLYELKKEYGKSRPTFELGLAVQIHKRFI